MLCIADAVRHVHCVSEWSSVCRCVRSSWNADAGPHVQSTPRQHSDAAQASSAQYTRSAPSLWTLQGNK